MYNIQPIILAAGKGTRIAEYSEKTHGETIPKVMLTLEKKPLLEYVVDSCHKAGFPKPIIVVGFKKEQIIDYFGDRCVYVEQKEQLGTGHAVKVCEDEAKEKAENFIVIYGDMPFWSVKYLKHLAETQANPEVDLTIGSVKFENPDFWVYGRILRDETGKVLGSAEQKDCTKDQRKIKECWPGIIAASNNWLWDSLKKIRTNNVQAEYYLNDLVKIAVQENLDIATAEVPEEYEALGINTPEQYEMALKTLDIYRDKIVKSR